MKREETVNRLGNWISKNTEFSGNGVSTKRFMTPTYKGEEAVTKTKLQQWLAKDNYKYRRPLSTGWLKHWCNVMQRGEFRGLNVGIAVCTFDNNRQLLINGSHSSTAAVKMDWTGKAMVEYYTVSSEEELQMLFASFDVIKSRSVEDIVVGVANEIGIKSVARILKKMPVAIQQIERVFTEKGLKVPRDFNPPVKNLFERAKLLDFYKDEIGIITDIFCEDNGEGLVLKNSSRYINHLVNRNILSAMLMTLAANPEQATKFWQDVILEEDRENRYASDFLKFFLTTLGERGGIMKVKVVAIAITSYNHYICGDEKTITIIRPKAVKGTNRLAKPAKGYIPNPLVNCNP